MQGIQESGNRLLASQIGRGLLVALLLAASFGTANARLDWTIDGQQYSTSTVQLWYEGYWRQAATVTAPVVHWKGDETEVTDCLVIWPTPHYPYDPELRKLVDKRPAAVLMLQNRKGAAGSGMFYVDGKDRSMINFPVAEAGLDTKNDPTKIVHGTVVTMSFENNEWKAVKLGTKFQAVCNFFLSIAEVGILLLGAWRLWQFHNTDGVSWLSIAPICIILELIAVALRLAFTCVDPFWTYRMLPTGAANALLTLHFPFALSSGILLTFYWAETLITTKIHASPFISDYRVVAIVVCVLLFVTEGVVLFFRISRDTATAFSPVIITIVFYVVVSAILTVCYIICAVSIMRRIAGMGSRRVEYQRQMTLRFTLSTAGYIATILLEIIVYIVSRNPWGIQIAYNLLFASLVWTAALQIFALRPLNGARSGSTHSKSDQSSQALATI